MNVPTYYQLNRTLERLAKVISHARYTGDRTGMIPEEALVEVLKEVADAVATLTYLTRDATNSKVFESKGTHDQPEPRFT